MLTLYEHPFALYCQKVLVALNEQGVAYDVLEEQRDFDRAQLAELWPPASIPVLRDGDQVIGETSIIIEHVAGARLVPSLEARKWDRICDQYISDAVQAIVTDTIEERFDERAVAQARGRLDMVYGMLEAQLRRTSSSPATRSRSPTAPPRQACSTPWRSTRGTRARTHR